MYKLYWAAIAFFLVPLQTLFGETITFDVPPPIPTAGTDFSSAGSLDFYNFRLGGELDSNSDILAGTEYIYAAYYPFSSTNYPYDITSNYVGEVAYFSSASLEPFTLNSMAIQTFIGNPILGIRRGVVVDQVMYNGSNTFNWTDIDAVLFPTFVGDENLDLYNIVIDEETTPSVPELSSIIFVSTGMLASLVGVRAGETSRK